MLLKRGAHAAHPREAVGDDLDVVVHEPHPRGSELVGDAHALAEAAGAAGVRLEAAVDEFGAERSRKDSTTSVVSSTEALSMITT